MKKCPLCNSSIKVRRTIFGKIMWCEVCKETFLSSQNIKKIKLIEKVVV